MAALVEVNCETDFVARTDDFQTLCKDLAMQVVAARPHLGTHRGYPGGGHREERQTYQSQVLDANKPPEIIAKIIEGKLAKFYEENCLLEQPSSRTRASRSRT